MKENIMDDAAHNPNTTSKDLTETGTLPIGFLIDGVRHQDFEMRLPTIGDQVDATMDTRTDSGIEIQMALYARQLLRLGTLPKERIDFELLLQMNPYDWNELSRVDDELRKKALREGQRLAGGTNFAQS